MGKSVREILDKIDHNLLEQDKCKYHSPEYNKLQKENEHLINQAERIALGQVS